MSGMPEMEAAEVAALRDLDEELAQQGDDTYVTTPKVQRVVVELTCNGTTFRALANPGSEINILGEHIVQDLHLLPRKLHRPTTLSLAVETQQPAAQLTHFTVANLRNPTSERRFNHTYFKLGNVGGGYDAILGTPFFNHFRFSVSVSQRAIVSEEDGMIIFDFRHLQKVTQLICRSAVPRVREPCETYQSDWESDLKRSEAGSGSASLSEGQTRESTLLHEFEALFPADIPAVSDEAEDLGEFTDGSFPAKMQLESSKIRHKIILSNPDAVINEKQ